MANCSCDVGKKLLTPGVFNLKQHLNGAEIMKWTLSSRYCENNNIDFMAHDAILVLQRGTGEPDEVLLTSTLNNDGTVTLSWDIGKYATWLTGYVKYQIVFRGKCKSELSVIMPDETDEANGGYAINDRTIEGYYRVWTNKANGAYTVQYNTSLKRWELLNGATVVSYQTFANIEPYCGTWDNAIVGSATACVWRSIEAVMYISESIAADEHVSARCPTILRQMYHGMQNICSKSGITALSEWVYTTSWYKASAPYYVKLHELFSVPKGCLLMNVRVQRENADGTFTDVDSIEVVEEDGEAKLYCNEKIDAKITASIRSAGGSYVFVDEKSVGHVGGWRIDKAGIAAELPDYNNEKAGFVFYATDTGMYYRKQSDTAGDWSEPYPFRGEPGTPGATGRPGKDGVSEVYVYNAIEEHNESANVHTELFAGKADKTHTHVMSEVAGLNDTLAKKATVDDVTALANRVTTSEKSITSLNTAVGDVNRALATTENNVRILNSTIGDITTALAAIVGE